MVKHIERSALASSVMTAERLRVVLLVNAAYSLAVGALLLAGTWDALWDALDLPQAEPALFVQIGGALLWGFAYLFWLAARTPSLMLPVARASALVDALSATVIFAWLIYDGLGIGTLGVLLLIAAGAVGVLFTLFKTNRRRPARRLVQREANPASAPGAPPQGRSGTATSWQPGYRPPCYQRATGRSGKEHSDASGRELVGRPESPLYRRSFAAWREAARRVDRSG